MRVALLHNHHNEQVLLGVIAEMMELGAPTIKVLDLGFDNMVQALEGCHRLRAAEILGLQPEWVWVDGQDTVGDLGLDYDCDPDTTVDQLGDYENDQIEFEG